MSNQPEYKGRFRHAALSRDDGVLEVRLHTDGGSLVWGASPHQELPQLFAEIANDRNNRVVILTGSGASFCADRDDTLNAVRTAPDGWDTIYWEGKAMLANLLSIEVPIIAAVNGPARHHAELPVLSDIVLASESAIFQDHAHFASGVVPGDGVQYIWPALLGPNRGSYFLLTGQELNAAEALRLGVVNEVLPIEALLSRAHELASELSKRSTLTLRYTRVALTQSMKQTLLGGLGYGLALEGLALARPAGEGV